MLALVNLVTLLIFVALAADIGILRIADWLAPNYHNVGAVVGLCLVVLMVLSLQVWSVRS